MKAAVIGYGSIGMRHARILKDMGHEVAVVSRREVGADRTFSTVIQAVDEWEPKYVVVASRTGEHLENVASLAATGYSGKVLIEKPLFDKVHEMPEHGFSDTFVGYNMRFDPVVRRFRELMAETPPHAVHAHAGQRLSEMRPDADYREGYSADRNQGGGVLRDLSHELDYLNWILGGWQRLTATGGHYSQLEITSDDVFSILFETANCAAVSVHVNYLDNPPKREITALTDKGSIHADLIAGTIITRDGTEVFKTERDDTFIAQHQAVLDGDESVICTLEEGMEVMRMIEAAETAAAEKMWVAA